MVILFLIASAAFYFTLTFVFINQVDDDLQIEKTEITGYIQKYERLPESISVKDQMINYIPVGHQVAQSYNTALLNDKEDRSREKYRQLVFSVYVDRQWYKIIVSKSLEDTEDLLHSILVISSVTIFLILLVSFAINRLALKKLWKPFYHSLQVVNNFKVSKNQNISWPSSNIEEFNFMNETLKKITQQAQHDYLALKTFSENASHEIQTPLAIIRSQADLLIQDDYIASQKTHALQIIYNSIDKLATLNRSLLLLAKIENNQFQEVHLVDITEKLEEKIANFSELWQSRQITVHASLLSVCVQMNETLADMLLNNLLSNATKHNFTGGTIDIELNDSKLMIVNTSSQPGLAEEELYQRFCRIRNEGENNGLGLSIIKQIVDSSSLTINYSFKNAEHAFIINWK